MCPGCLKMQALHDQDSKRGLFTTPQVIMAQLAPALSLRSVSYVSKQASLPSARGVDYGALLTILATVLELLGQICWQPDSVCDFQALGIDRHL